MTVGYSNSDEKTWSLVAHFSGVLGFVPPLIVFLVKDRQPSTVRAHSLAALNFQIVCFAVLIGLWIFSFFAGLILPDFLSWLFSLASIVVVWTVSVVFAIIGGLKANRGEIYRYPFQANLVK